MPVSGSGQYTFLITIEDRKIKYLAQGATPGVRIDSTQDAVTSLGCGLTARVSGLGPDMQALRSALISADIVDDPKERRQREDTLDTYTAKIRAVLADHEKERPVWPHPIELDSHVHAAALLAEASSNAVDSARAWELWGEGSLDDVRASTIRAGAVILRFLTNMDKIEARRERGVQ